MEIGELIFKRINDFDDRKGHLPAKFVVDPFTYSKLTKVLGFGLSYNTDNSKYIFGLKVIIDKDIQGWYLK